MVGFARGAARSLTSLKELLRSITGIWAAGSSKGVRAGAQVQLAWDKSRPPRAVGVSTPILEASLPTPPS
ncbi:hypothetical protein GCM10023063_00780 [Arthrobacter methylotrophus]